MRKLSQSEIQKIDHRLKSLQIRYTEVYEEIKDHYHTLLELTAEKDSAEVFEKLNSDFSRKQIKRMENEAQDASEKKLTRIQLDGLKFWKYDLLSLLIPFLLLVSSLGVSYIFGPYILITWISAFVIIGFFKICKKEKNLIRFNIQPWNRGTVTVVNQVIYTRYSFLLGVMIASIVNIHNIDITHLYQGAEFYTIGNLILITLLLYCLSFYHVIATIKKKVCLI